MTQRSEVHVARWFKENREEDFIDAPAGTDDDIDHIEEQLESTGSEYSTVAEDNPDEDDLDWETVFYCYDGPNTNNYHLGLEGTKWMKKPIDATVFLHSDYIPHIQLGPTDYAKSRKTQAECFDLFFDKSIISMIAKCTNYRIIKEQKKFARERDAKLTDEVEIGALLGIFLLGGCTKTSNFMQLFDAKRGTGMEAVYLAMSAQRYKFLLKNLRFSDPKTERTSEDKMAPIRNLFQTIVNNFMKHYTPSHELQLGDLITPFKGRCAFRQHMPKKSVKFGIKMFALVDCMYPYTYNLEVYVGDNPGPYDVTNRKLDIVVRMTDPIQGEYRNVTMSNWFTTLETADVLFNKKITIVGAMRPNKKEVPRIFRTVGSKALHSSLFAYNNVSTLVQYICKPDKAVLLLSSKHCEGTINKESGAQQKPDILIDYNQMKKGIDTVDKLCSSSDATRNSRRWPLNILFRLLNLAALNALCIFTINKREGQDITGRREFLIELALTMIKPMVQRRMYAEVTPKVVKQKMYEFLNLPMPMDVELQIDLSDKRPTCGRGGHRGRCYICRQKNINKSTRDVCASCTKLTCFDHIEYVCICCYEKDTKYTN